MTRQIVCRDLLELISGYLDGTVPADVHAAIEEHVSGCDGCTAVLEEFRITIAMTGTLTEGQITPAQRDTMLTAFRGWAG